MSTLLAVLKAKGWGLALSAGLDVEVSDFSTMAVTVKLSDEGLKHVEQVVSLAYAYVRLVREQGVSEPRWKEMVQLAEVDFNQWAKPSAAKYAKGLASKMHTVPLGADLLGPPSRMQWTDTDAVAGTADTGAGTAGGAPPLRASPPAGPWRRARRAHPRAETSSRRRRP